jgi:hypothetical protein
MVRWGGQADSGFGDDGLSAPFLDDTLSTGRRWQPSRLKMAPDPAKARPDRLPPVVVTRIAVVLGLAALMFWIIAKVAH